jgi:hypothetical protein
MPIEGCHCYACKPILGGVCCGIPDMLLLVTMYCVGLVYRRAQEGFSVNYVNSVIAASTRLFSLGEEACVGLSSLRVSILCSRLPGLK